MTHGMTSTTSCVELNFVCFFCFKLEHAFGLDKILRNSIWDVLESTSTTAVYVKAKTGAAVGIGVRAVIRRCYIHVQQSSTLCVGVW